MKKRKFKELCSHDGCSRRAKAKHECLTCERLGAAEPFAMFACGYHQNEVLAAVKKHALVKHPTNMLGAAWAALKGEDVF